MTSISKTNQLYKKKTKKKKATNNLKNNDKHLSKNEQKKFINFIFDMSEGICQLCNKKNINEFHHSVFGCFGANKDDRTLVGICHDCHHSIHHGIKGNGIELRKKAIEISKKNWKDFNEK